MTKTAVQYIIEEFSAIIGPQVELMHYVVNKMVEELK
jgi:hypothetical protein